MWHNFCCYFKTLIMLNVIKMFYFSYNMSMTDIYLICSQKLQGKSNFLPILSQIYQHSDTLYRPICDFGFASTALKPCLTKLFYSQEWRKFSKIFKFKLENDVLMETQIQMIFNDSYCKVFVCEIKISHIFLTLDYWPHVPK